MLSSSAVAFGIATAGAFAAAGCARGDPVRPPESHAVESFIREGHYEQAEIAARARFEARRLGDPVDLTGGWGASNLLVRALLANGRGGLPAARELAEEALQRLERRDDVTDTALAETLVVLGSTLTEAADYGRAISVLERARDKREGSTRLDDVSLAEALDQLGHALTGARRYDDALRELDRSLRLKERALGSADVGVARTLEAICLTLQRRGDYVGARRALQRAMAIQERANPAHPAYVDGLNLLHQQLWFEGRLAESRDAARRAVELAERTLRADHPTLARSLRYLATAEWSLGDLRRGQSLWQRAFAMATRNFGADHHETAMYLHELAQADLALGEYPIARTRFARALEVFEARYGPDHDFVATALHNLAVVDAQLGDLPNARREQARATAIWEQTLGADHPFVAFGLTELAGVLRAQGVTADARAMLERALAIREKALGSEHPDVARTLADLATTVMPEGRYELAHALANRALRIWDRQNVPDAPEFARVLTLYGTLELNAGRPQAAQRTYQRALAIREKVVGQSHPDFAEGLSGLALAQARSGNRKAALATATKAETTAREHLRLLLKHLPERQSLGYAASRPGGLDLMLSMAGVEAGAAAPGLDAVVRGRALVLDEVAARRRPGRSGDQRMLALQNELASAEQRLANLLVRRGDVAATAHVTLVDAARRESETAELRLAEQSAAFRAELSQAQLGLDDIRAGLPPGSALVSYVRYYRMSLASGPQKSRAGPRAGVASYVAFVLGPAAPVIAVQLGAAVETERFAAAWRDDISRTQPALLRGGENRSRQSGLRFRANAWDPIAPYLSGATRVFVVPDGAIALVPLAALPGRTSPYLLEEAPPIHYLSAERDLVATPSRPAVSSGGLLALGGAAFDDSAAAGAGPSRAPSGAAVVDASSTTRAAWPVCGSLHNLRFQPLDGTREEVQELARVWSGPARGGREPARILTGRQASEAAFKQDAHRYRVLHLATHGFFLGGACDGRSGISTTRGVGGLWAGITVDNPLLLSGLALAGANRRALAGPDEDDGILTAEEVASLDLDGVEWAVLSACDTGVGEVRAGEGVFGLRRAFQVAGARTVVMSLWSVDDQATRAWMRALYEGRFQRHLSTADAVHAASLSRLRDRRATGQSTHPFYWAAFVAAGDWR